MYMKAGKDCADTGKFGNGFFLKKRMSPGNWRMEKKRISEAEFSMKKMKRGERV